MLRMAKSGKAYRSWILLCAWLAPAAVFGEAYSDLAATPETRLLPIIRDGWAGSSVNVIAGLQNNLITEGGVQFAAFYDGAGEVVLAKRSLESDFWEVERTGLRGNVVDAHNTVAIAIDGRGHLHLAWDHHNNPLKYTRSVEPGVLKVGEAQPMTGRLERSVTYPSFLRLPDGDLLFIYRDGGSGRGNLALNRYNVDSEAWSQVQPILIDGEGRRNAYASSSADGKGGLHLAWVWRETPDVRTNQDLCYARSLDGGVTWTNVDGVALEMPIRFDSPTRAVAIAQDSALMNPPALALDQLGQPYIANYWKPNGSDTPQYHLVHYEDGAWRAQQVTQRTTPFDLSGTATKRPPISRSSVFAQLGQDGKRRAVLVYRDDERGERIVAARCLDLGVGEWSYQDLTSNSVGSWEASADAELWRGRKQIHMLTQRVYQKDGNDAEGASVEPTPVYVLEWDPELD